MALQELLDAAEAQIPEGQSDGMLVSMPVDGLYTVRHKEITGFQTLDIGPFASLILRGRKEGKIGDHVVEFTQAQTSILSHHVPVQYRIADVGENGPFIALLFNIDFGILRQLESRIEKLVLSDQSFATLDRVQPDSELHNALERYAKLDSSALENEILGPSILEEVHFRLLQSKNAGMLRKLLEQDSNASKIAEAIVLIRANLKSPPSVNALAAQVKMGSSSFHAHFKRVTGKTPANFTRELRLNEAKRLITHTGARISTAAFEVGYSSVPHFSREYKKMFGSSPSTKPTTP